MMTPYFVIRILSNSFACLLIVVFEISKLLQESNVILVKQSNIIDPVPDHRDAFNAEAKRPAAPDFWIVADVLEYLRMHHAAAGDLQPLLTHLSRQRTAEVNFEARFGVTEIMRAKTNAGVRAHQFLKHELHCSFEVPNRDVPVHVKAF